MGETPGGGEYGQSFGNTGVWPSVANRQLGFNSLVQLASVTGWWGISFVVYWFAATVNWALTGPAAPRMRGLLTYGSVLAAVLLFGALRTAPALRSGQSTVRVAGITVDNLRCLVRKLGCYNCDPCG